MRITNRIKRILLLFFGPLFIVFAYTIPSLADSITITYEAETYHCSDIAADAVKSYTNIDSNSAGVSASIAYDTCVALFRDAAVTEQIELWNNNGTNYEANTHCLIEHPNSYTYNIVKCQTLYRTCTYGTCSLYTNLNKRMYLEDILKDPNLNGGKAIISPDTEVENNPLNPPTGPTTEEYMPEVVIEVNGESQKIYDLIKVILNILSGLVLVFAVIMLIVGGIQYSAAGGDPSGVKAAKTKITNVLIGVVAYVFLYAFLQWLIPGGVPVIK